MYTNEIFESLASWPRVDAGGAGSDRAANAGKSERVETLYRSLKSDILCAKFEPGVRLIEERLAERYGLTSRTPVREVMARLKSEGHVSVRGRSYISPVYSSESLLKLYDVRMSLEVLAVQGATASGDTSKLRACLKMMSEAHERRDPIAVNATDGLFHLKVAEISGNEVLISILSQLHEKVFQIRNLFFATELQQQDIVALHHQLLTAIERGVPEIAMAEMSHHLTESQQKFKEQMN